MDSSDIPQLKVSTGWIDVSVLEEPTVKATFKGYAPILKVRANHTGLEYFLYISAKSITEGLEPLRQQNGGKFCGLK